MKNGLLSRAQSVAQEIREDIIRGYLIPDMALIENEMVMKYSTSRNTVREALHQLQSEGLTTYIRNKGVYVRRLAKEDLREIFQARRLIELQAIYAFKKNNNTLIDQLEDDIQAAERAIEQENWQMVGTMSLRFHQHIVSALDNTLISNFFRIILAQLRLIFSLDPDEATFQRPWLEEDQKILQLLATCKFEAAHEALAIYLDISENKLLQLYDATSH